MDFAPYQDASPENTRAMSPPLGTMRSPMHSPRPSLSTNPSTRPAGAPRSASNALGTSALASQQNNGYFGSGDVERGAGGWVSPGGRENLDLFETRLGIRMDWEACLAYLLLPPAGGVLLLVVEQRSDYVRFHAWQSALLFSFMFVVHVLFSWSTAVSWMLFVADLATIGYLTMRAYRDAETLDRCEVPFFGSLASSFLDDE